MPTELVCACGHRWRVEEGPAARLVPCPRCGAAVAPAAVASTPQPPTTEPRAAGAPKALWTVMGRGGGPPAQAPATTAAPPAPAPPQSEEKSPAAAPLPVRAKGLWGLMQAPGGTR